MKRLLIGAMTLFLLLPLLAAAAADEPGKAPEAQQKQLEQQKQQLQSRTKDREQLEKQLQEAQKSMQEAARRVAELSMQLSGPMNDRKMRMYFTHPDHAILGITIGGDAAASRSTNGARVLAVTPNGPAEQAGLRAGDVITGINETTFKSEGEQSAADKLVEFMDKVKPGDSLKVAYTRDGKPATAQLKAGQIDAEDFAFAFGAPPAPPPPPSPPAAIPAMPGMPAMRHFHTPSGFAWYMESDAMWGDMELTPLSTGLGQYFGTSKGLLVVHAPKSDALKLQDGDVILSIGGREPGSPTHAMRILRSYGPGDALKLEIMRKGKSVNLSVTLPEKKGTEMGGDFSDLYRTFHFGPSFLHFGFE